MSKLMKKILYTMLIFCFFCSSAQAGFKEFVAELKHDISATWDSSKYDAYIPIYAWHNRLTYDQEHIEKYNENPWGFGLGKSRYDEKGNWHSLYAMGFKDSNKHLETFFGYAYMKNWQIGDNPDFRAGVGYTLGFTQRTDWYYLPMPAPLPIAGLEYKRLAIQGAYVPGVKNDGNVLFLWTKLSLN